MNHFYVTIKTLQQHQFVLTIWKGRGLFNISPYPKVSESLSGILQQKVKNIFPSVVVR